MLYKKVKARQFGLTCTLHFKSNNRKFYVNIRTKIYEKMERDAIDILEHVDLNFPPINIDKTCISADQIRFTILYLSLKYIFVNIKFSSYFIH